jgi:NDP-sugar pyrophosphorylase family protein
LHEYRNFENLVSCNCNEKIIIRLDSNNEEIITSGDDYPSNLMALQKKIVNDTSLPTREKQLCKDFFLDFVNTYSYHFQPAFLKGLFEDDKIRDIDEIEKNDFNKIPCELGNTGSGLQAVIKYIKEKKPLGTAGGLSLGVFNHYKTAIVSNGDVLTEVSYKNLLSYHQNSKNDLTIGVKNIKTVNPYGVIKFSKSRKIENLIEKPVHNNYVSAGVYVFETKLFSFIKKNKHLDMTSLINFFIKKNKKIGACPIHENWIDIGSHSDLSKVI